ncbi:MAG: hypothetical protein JSV16_14050 [Candidatus Hydrogenedentota bacterium]|nr:MAG: hypothetical protein JSV16_14050 [Candidatus Hydrogenedentota bacterium]
MVTGRVSYRDREPKIVAEDIVPIDKAEEQFARAAHIKFMTAGMEENTLAELAEIVAANEGDCKLFIHCITRENHETIIESSTGKGLKPGHGVKEKVEALLGESSIWFSAHPDANPS